MSRVTDMTKGSPTKLLILFAIPLILGNLGQQLYTIVDTIIVGQGVGVEALAAVGATDWTYWLILWIAQALTQGFSILISQHFGSGDPQKIKKAVSMSILLCVVFGILLTGLGLAIVYPMLHLLQTPDEIFGGAVSYLVTLFSGILIVTAYNMASAILRALGDGKTPLIAMAVAAATNIGLDLLFVMVFHWGIIGAAVATLIAQLIAFLYCYFVLRRLDLIRVSKADFAIDWAVIRQLCRLGFPLALQNILIAVGGMVLQRTINLQGYLFIAGFTATNKLYGLLEISAVSLGYAVSTFMAQNFGARLNRRIHQGMRSVTIIALLVSVCISVLMILFGKPILSLFISASDADAPKVLEIAYHYLLIISCLLFFLYLLYCCRSTLQGLGNTLAPTLSGFMEFAMRILVALLFTRWWGEEAIFFAEPLAWIGAVIVLISACIWRMKKIPHTDGEWEEDTRGKRVTGKRLGRLPFVLSWSSQKARLARFVRNKKGL